MKTINNLILFLALSLPKFFLFSDLSIQRPLLIVLIVINLKTITYQIIHNKNIFYYVLFVLIYIVSISDLFNKRIALDLIRLTVNIAAIWFIYYKTKKEYLYFSNSFCYLSTFFMISYILQHNGIDLYIWENTSPKEFAGSRYFGNLLRVSLAYSPKSGSVLYFGIFMYFYYIKYKHIPVYNKLIIRLGFYTSLLLFLLCQTVSGYILGIIAMMHFTLIRSTIGYRVVHDYSKIIVIVISAITTLCIMYYLNLGSTRVIVIGIFEDIHRIIGESLFIGSGYAHVLFEFYNLFGLNSDYSLFLVLIYELGFIPILVLSSILCFMNKIYIIYYFYFVLCSVSAHSTNNLIFYCLIVIMVNNLIEHNRYITYVSRKINYSRNYMKTQE